ncbi:integral membrane protein [Rutstroemia sp. NJR-2017a BBW]|nr:integral membrane protein [Rutstroemia sp. NJR-2017a BBW]
MYSLAPSPTSTTMSSASPIPAAALSPDVSAPSIFRYILGFLLIGVAWGFTTPFIRAAARTHQPPTHPILQSPGVANSFVKRKLYGAFFGVVDLLKNPRYAIPLVVNLTGSVWFFLLIGQAELSLTVPITNSLAFLFTVLGEWWVERKVISRGEFPYPSL